VTGEQTLPVTGPLSRQGTTEPTYLTRP
jgi:hypothetical protein